MHTSKTVSVLLLLLLVAAATPAWAAVRARSWPKWQQRRVALDHCLVRDEFRIYYALAGRDALPRPDQTDRDGNGTPDKVENVALQLVAARRVFTEVMGLQHPLRSPRYSGQAKFIDVHLWDLHVNGSAGDATVNYHRPNDPPEGVGVVTIDVSRKLPFHNLTPAHELFHIFQNGYTLFKNAWYYEGMARWSESALGKGAGRAGALPASPSDVAALLKLKYGASQFWIAAARQMDQVGRLALPDDLRTLKYIGSQRPVVADDAFYGAAFLKRVLEALDPADDAASKGLGRDPMDWKEAQQRSPDNDKYIWAAVLDVLPTACRGSFQ